MIEETGIVVDVTANGIARVRCVRSSACDHCDAKSACHAGHGREERVVEALNGPGARIGDRVVIAIGSDTLLRSSFLVYIVPLVALVFCSLVAKALAPRLLPDVDPELVTALSGISGLLLALVGLKLRQKRFDAESYLPRIVRVESGRDG